MKLTLRQSWQTVSIEGRWHVAGADPMDRYLQPQKQFVPAEILIGLGISVKLNGTVEPHTSVYAWPSDREVFTSAHLRSDSIDSISAPSWVEHQQRVLLAELLGERTPDEQSGVKLAGQYISRGTGIHESWDLEDAPLILGRQPKELEVGWMIGEGRPNGEEARYRVTFRDALGIIDDLGGLLEQGWKVEQKWATEVADAALARLMLNPLDPAKLLASR